MLGRRAAVGAASTRGTAILPAPFAVTVARRIRPASAQTNAGCGCPRLGDARHQTAPVAIVAKRTSAATPARHHRSGRTSRGSSRADAVASAKTASEP